MNTPIDKIKEVCSKFAGSYCQTISDPVQTHAIYGVHKDKKDDVEQALKNIGAKKFRKVQPHAKGLVIICFDATDIK